ncbi:MAG: hypothetical protein ACT4O2_11430 [Beijerinckiaceae bacterium]
MRIFKLVLLTVIRVTLVVVLKAVIFVYMLSRPERPLAANQGENPMLREPMVRN